MEGWIKIHRRLLESGFWNDSYAVHLWVHLLLHASYEPRKTFFNGKIVQLKVGQLITGRKKLSQETGISEQIIRKWLDLFEINQQLTIEKTSAGSCISILNFKFYQQDNQRSTTKLTNNQPTVNQQPTNDQPLYKEIEEGKEVEEIKKKGFSPPTILEAIDYFEKMKSSKPVAEKFHDHFTSNGWLVSGKAKMKDWQASARNWIKNELKWNPPTQQSTGRKYKPYIPDEQPRRSNQPATPSDYAERDEQPIISIKLGDYQHLIKEKDQGNSEQQ